MTEQPPAQSERWIQGKRGLQRETYETPQDHAQSTENEARRLADIIDDIRAWHRNFHGDQPMGNCESCILSAALSDAEAKLREAEEALREIRDEIGSLSEMRQRAQTALTRSNDEEAE